MIDDGTVEPGKLRYFASVQTNAPSADGDSWTETRKQWVSIDPIAASKLVFLSAQGSKVTHRIIARDLPLLTVGQRIVYDGQNFQITEVQRFRGDRQEALAETVV